MAIAGGMRLGPHEIPSAVGAGGMGEVYRERDTRLDRLAAIKVLPAHLADKPELRDLFCRSGSKMMAVETATLRFVAGKPRTLFEGPYLATLLTSSYYDVAPDGQRFLVLKPTGQAQASTQINVVLNWFDDLKRRVPVKK